MNLKITAISATLILCSCVHKGPNPLDPFESINRKVDAFNRKMDSIFLKPPAKLYKAVLPPSLRKGINNAYTNLDLIPTVVNDILQAEGKWAIRDSWRFAINSTLGVGGLFDIACKWGLPPHSNDLGLTLAKWGDKDSPYLVIPFLGPSTLRDGAGWLFQFALYSPYVYLRNDAVMYGLLGLRLVDLRSQFLDSEKLMGDALDQYTFLRDAYLQHRNYLISGAEEDKGTLYIEDGEADAAASEEAGSDYVS